ncbi:MAG: hypothetical protein PWQ56_363 [Patescibacteria group bacterium]|nr:hypothetical protein [Patescibacteria group bacterium]
MSNYNDLKIFQKVYDLILWSHPIISRFPKNERFVLGQRMEKLLMDILNNVLIINKEGKEEKQKQMRDLSYNLDKLMIMWRLSKDLKFTSIKRYGLVVEKINEIGKMITGWQKALF